MQSAPSNHHRVSCKGRNHPNDYDDIANNHTYEPNVVISFCIFFSRGRTECNICFGWAEWIDRVQNRVRRIKTQSHHFCTVSKCLSVTSVIEPGT